MSRLRVKFDVSTIVEQILDLFEKYADPSGVKRIGTVQVSRPALIHSSVVFRYSYDSYRSIYTYTYIYIYIHMSLFLYVYIKI